MFLHVIIADDDAQRCTQVVNNGIHHLTAVFNKRLVFLRLLFQHFHDFLAIP